MKYFRNTLVLCNSLQQSKTETSLLFYDILSGTTDKITTEVCNQMIICSNKHKLFTISVIENNLKSGLLSFSKYKKVRGNIELRAAQSIEQPFKTKLSIFNKIRLFFAHCVATSFIFFILKINTTIHILGVSKRCLYDDISFKNIVRCE